MTPFRALIVEDNKNYSRFLLLILQDNTQCQVVGEASDGLEAVRLAEELQLDLILLDPWSGSINIDCGGISDRQRRSFQERTRVCGLARPDTTTVVHWWQAKAARHQ